MKISRLSVGMAVRAARQAARLSLTDISDATAISSSALSRIETGQRSLDFIEAIVLANALKVDMEHFRQLAETFEESGSAKQIAEQREFLTSLRKIQRLAILTAIDASSDSKELN